MFGKIVKVWKRLSTVHCWNGVFKSATKDMEKAGFSWISGAEMKASELHSGYILVKNRHNEVLDEFVAKGVDWALTLGSIYIKEPEYGDW